LIGVEFMLNLRDLIQVWLLSFDVINKLRVAC